MDSLGARAAKSKTSRITATLEGKLSYDAIPRRYSMVGTWHCPMSRSFPPQKFALLKSLEEGECPDQEPTESSMNGSFNGYSVVTTKSSPATNGGQPVYQNRLVFENNVKLKFTNLRQCKVGNTNTGTSTSSNSNSLSVHGSGANKFGAFQIYGTATPCIGKDHLYTITLKKQYMTRRRRNASCATLKVRNSPQGRRIVYSGYPLQPLEGGWPSGWVEEVCRRQNGATKGRYDRLWYTPKEGFKFRSMKGVRKFIALVEKSKGDEVKAWELFGRCV